jgi:hypothetical protein
MAMLMIFRQYDDKGVALVNGYVVERIAHTQEDQDSYIKELKALDYELEGIYPEDGE